MDALVRTPHITTNLTPKLIRLVGNGGITWNQTPFLTFSKGYSSISANRLRKSVVAEAKKRKKDSVDAHNFVPKPDEATGVFPEAVLLKEVTPTSSFPFSFFFFPNFCSSSLHGCSSQFAEVFSFRFFSFFQFVLYLLDCILFPGVLLSATVFHDFVV